jgi:hypothetical protein
MSLSFFVAGQGAVLRHTYLERCVDDLVTRLNTQPPPLIKQKQDRKRWTQLNQRARLQRGVSLAGVMMIGLAAGPT